MKDLTKILEEWTLVKGELKQRIVTLTDNELLLLQVKREELVARLQIKLGKTKEQARKILTDL
jgi:uncharacterized protein YjbJ (UPF0337 family)